MPADEPAPEDDGVRSDLDRGSSKGTLRRGIVIVARGVRREKLMFGLAVAGAFTKTLVTETDPLLTAWAWEFGAGAVLLGGASMLRVLGPDGPPTPAGWVGLGVAVAPKPLVMQDLKLGRLVAPFGFVRSGRQYCLLHPAELAGLAKVRTFRTWIENARRLPMP